MKKCLLISFDLIREGEIEKSLSIASLIAFAKSDERYGTDFTIEHISFNMLKAPNIVSWDFFEEKFKDIDISSLDSIALSCYVWNEYLLYPLYLFFKKSGFKGKYIGGGYQISYSYESLLVEEYPFIDIYINGYGEKSLLSAILMKKPTQKVFLNEQLDFHNLPSPYLTGEIQVQQSEQMVRFETQRGCPYRCTFCAHRDLATNKIHKHPLDKVFEELAFLKEKDVKRINILDPIFNVGKNYISILKEIQRIALKANITLQTRLEKIDNLEGDEFLQLCSQSNITLEFGLQTIFEEEYKVIHRKNNIEKINRALEKINDLNINYEISLIYGLPNQTVETFKKSIDFAVQSGCKIIKAYPLMLLKGTELYTERKKWNMKEKTIGDYHIPVVVSSSSFTEEDWWEMKYIADSLPKSVYRF